MLIARLNAYPDWSAEVWRFGDVYRVQYEAQFSDDFDDLDRAVAHARACIEAGEHKASITWAAVPGSV